MLAAVGDINGDMLAAVGEINGDALAAVGEIYGAVLAAVGVREQRVRRGCRAALRKLQLEGRQSC